MSVTSGPARLRYRHASGLHAVTRALETLHHEVLRSDGDDQGRVRTSVMNLVAACNDGRRGDRAAEDLLSIGARHPARAIVIVADPSQEPQLEADISLHFATGSRAGTELVRLWVHGEPAYHLTGIVTPLLVPDMPVYLWVVGAPPLRQAFGEEAVALTDRMIIDSGEYTDAAETLSLLSQQLDRYGEDLLLADIAWERTRPWREAIAQAFNLQAARPWLRDITRVTVHCAGELVLADAWLFAGWMSSRLGWSGGRVPRLSVDADARAAAAPSGVLTAVRVQASRDTRSADVSLERRGDSLHTAIDIENVVAATRAITLPARDQADLISSMMTEGGGDPIYRAAVAAAAALAGGG